MPVHEVHHGDHAERAGEQQGEGQRLGEIDAERDQADEDDRRGAGEENEVLFHRVPSWLTAAESFTAARMDW
jgi:hypothetical protein